MFSRRSSHGGFIAAALIIAVLLPNGIAVASVVLQGGSDDGFAPGPDLASPSSALLARILDGFGTTGNFDGLAHNQQVAHTFDGLPDSIVGGTLEFRVRGGSPPGVDTDGLIISFVDAGTVVWTDDIVWARPFGSLSVGGTVLHAPDPGFVTSGVVWSPGMEQLVLLDLGALPLVGGGTLDLIPMLNEHRFVDVTVSDDSIADFYRLNLTVPPAIPVPSAILLTTIGTGLLAWLRRRRTL